MYFRTIIVIVTNAPLAQLVEHLTLNQVVQSSSLWWCTKKKRQLSKESCLFFFCPIHYSFLTHISFSPPFLLPLSICCNAVRELVTRAKRCKMLPFVAGQKSNISDQKWRGKITTFFVTFFILVL